MAAVEESGKKGSDKGREKGGMREVEEGERKGGEEEEKLGWEGGRRSQISRKQSKYREWLRGQLTYDCMHSRTCAHGREKVTRGEDHILPFTAGCLPPAHLTAASRAHPTRKRSQKTSVERIWLEAIIRIIMPVPVLASTKCKIRFE